MGSKTLLQRRFLKPDLVFARSVSIDETARVLDLAVLRREFIIVACYDRGNSWVVPNPQDPALVAQFTELHAGGHYVDMMELVLRRADFNRRDMWQDD